MKPRGTGIGKKRVTPGRLLAGLLAVSLLFSVSAVRASAGGSVSSSQPAPDSADESISGGSSAFSDPSDRTESFRVTAFSGTTESFRTVSSDNPGMTDTVTSSDGNITADFSHTSDGYVRVSCIGESDETDRVRILLTLPDGTVCPYPVTFAETVSDDIPPTYNTVSDLSWVTVALTGGSGNYRLDVQEYSSADGNYAYVFSKTFSADISDSSAPALISDYYVNFSSDDEVSRKAAELTKDCTSDLEMAGAIYSYVISHISYNEDEAAWVSSAHVPDPLSVYTSGTGIALDFASLTCAMLRSVGIPARLVSGYSGSQFHSWVSVYLKTAGTAEEVITSSGNEWVLLDPVIGSANSAEDVKRYVSSGTHYTPMYVY